jgi:hypothetical protein
MSKPKKTTIEVQGTTITILSSEQGDYISLTDMVRRFEGGGALIEQWLKSKDTAAIPGVASTCQRIFPILTPVYARSSF